MRPEKSGRNIIVKNPDDFEEWLDMDDLTDDGEDSGGGILGRLLG